MAAEKKLTAPTTPNPTPPITTHRLQAINSLVIRRPIFGKAIAYERHPYSQNSLTLEIPRSWTKTALSQSYEPGRASLGTLASFCLWRLPLMDFDAFSGCSWLCSYFVSLSLACNMSANGTRAKQRKKKRWRFVGDVKRLEILTSDAVRPHSYTSTCNLGVTPLMLWTLLILRRCLTIVCFTVVFVPCAHVSASSPIGCITILLHLRG